MLLDLTKVLTVLRSDCTKLWLEAVCCVSAYIIIELNVLHVQLILDDSLLLTEKLLVSLDIHLADRLSVLDICCISCCTSQNNDLQDLVHSYLELWIDHLLIHLRE